MAGELTLPNTSEMELWRLVNNAFQNSIEKFGDIFAKDVTRDLLANGVAVQKWIPVTERLPDETKDEYVLVVCDYHGKIKVETRKMWHIDSVVTHWMPLPEPPTDLPRITDQTMNALEKMGEKTHGVHDNEN